MKKEIIKELFNKFEGAGYEYNGIDCWSARELQEVLEYTQWRNFQKVIAKAKEACTNSEQDIADHFVEVNRTIELGSGSTRNVKDVALTRYACYLIAQNGDPAKPKIAFAQTYFAVQTRKQEIIEARLHDIDRINAREKLSKSEKVLSGIIYERGVNNRSFALIRSKGDKALFGGITTEFMKRRLCVPPGRPLADFLPALTMKAKDFATELTSHNVIEKDLHGDKAITKEHVENNQEVRNILLNRGVKPENLPPAEDIKKVQRRINSEEKKLLKEVKKKNKR